MRRGPGWQETRWKPILLRPLRPDAVRQRLVWQCLHGELCIGFTTWRVPPARSCLGLTAALAPIRKGPPASLTLGFGSRSARKNRRRARFSGNHGKRSLFDQNFRKCLQSPRSPSDLPAWNFPSNCLLPRGYRTVLSDTSQILRCADVLLMHTLSPSVCTNRIRQSGGVVKTIPYQSDWLNHPIFSHVQDPRFLAFTTMLRL